MIVHAFFRIRRFERLGFGYIIGFVWLTILPLIRQMPTGIFVSGLATNGYANHLTVKEAYYHGSFFREY